MEAFDIDNHFESPEIASTLVNKTHINATLNTSTVEGEEEHFRQLNQSSQQARKEDLEVGKVLQEASPISSRPSSDHLSNDDLSSATQAL